MNFFENILNLIFPIQCGICGNLGHYICDNCYNKLKSLEIKKQYEDIFFVYQYEGIIRDLMISYKFNDKAYLYKTFSESLLKNKKLCNFVKCYDIITSVPLHKKRFNERGYNQSELIAREVSKNLTNVKTLDKLNVLYVKDILIKNKNIKPQSTKNVKDRIKDVNGIYEVKNKNLIKGKKIIIFDDIYTTGSTIGECKKVLLQAGALKVGIVALAKDYVD